MIKGTQIEAWSTLKGVAASSPKFSYSTMKSKTFPFKYKGFNFRKLTINRNNAGLI
tara:strand:- start:1757 stop:1924 length:168 start_codon:yes stop_codon:yes gene_type:complete